MTSRAVTRFRFATIVCGAALIVLTAAMPAFAQSMIKEAAFTNPIAYELKSLQRTHFYGTFDRAVWAVLTIHDAAGMEVARIFDGPVPEANKRFWFPGWNGLSSSGKQLYTSTAFQWRLRVVRGGVESVATGRITISKVTFTVRGSFPDASNQSAYALRVDRYLIDGPVIFYVRATRPGEGVTRFKVEIPVLKPDDWGVVWLSRDVTATKPLSDAAGLHTQIPRRALYPFLFQGDGPVWFEMTFLQ